MAEGKSPAMRPSRMTTVMSRSGDAPVPSMTVTWVSAVTGGGVWAEAEVVASAASASTRRRELRLTPTEQAENEGVGHQQRWDDRGWNEECGAELPGADPQLRPLVGREQQVGGPPHVEHPD